MSHVALTAPLSGGSSASGEAIQRGLLLAIDDVNAEGGVLGHRLELVTRDVQNDPAAGVVALRDLAQRYDLVGVFGGIYSPVMLEQLDVIHELRVPLINPWGSVTAITHNGRQPNYAFRVSVSDHFADEFLVRYAVHLLGMRSPGIIADTTIWGSSNTEGLAEWLQRLGVRLSGVERFDQGENNMTAQLVRLRQAGADGLLMVSNAPEGAAIARGLATLGWRPPLVSHWGISGGAFVERAGVENAEGVYTLQSFSFLDRLSPRAEAVLRRYHARYGTRRAEEIQAPVGVAHAYDGLRMLAAAIEQARSTDGARVQAALEALPPYEGVVKHYAPAFTPERHDALLAQDYLMAVWRDGRLAPAERARLP